MGSAFSFLLRNYRIFNPPAVPKTEKPIRFGILGAARIAPLAIIWPAKSHPEVAIVAVAARNKEKAEKFAKKHGIPIAYSGPNGYQELSDDTEIDAVYNPLPNGLHFEWSMKALKAGKHVLLEKPMCNTEDETRRLTEYAESKGLIIMEAFHYRFHPSVHRIKELVDSGKYGRIKHISTSLAISKVIPVLEKNDIRLQYGLGGGCMMDMGGYTLSAARLMASSNPIEVKSVTNSMCPTDEKVDLSTNAELQFPDNVTASLYCNFEDPPMLWFIPSSPKTDIIVELEGGQISLSNFVGPHFYHRITIQEKLNGETKKKVETAYTFKDGRFKDEEYWTTYRYMLEAFVDKLRGRTPHTWIDANESIENMHWIDKIYEKGGLPLRPNSNYAVAEV